jgi:hypothetical protein
MTFTIGKRRYTFRLVCNRTEYAGRTSRAIGFVLHVDQRS